MRESPAKNRSGLPIPATACNFLRKARLRQRRRMRIDPVQTRGMRRMRNAPDSVRHRSPRRVHAAIRRLRKGPAGSSKPLPNRAHPRLRFRISLQVVMLQSVVAEDHVAASMGCEQRARCGGAIRADPHGHPERSASSKGSSPARAASSPAFTARGPASVRRTPTEDSGRSPWRAAVDEREDQRVFSPVPRPSGCRR